MELFHYDTEKAFDYENGFYLAGDIRRIGKLLAHYELFKMITDLPGHVVECGVFKGASAVRFTTFIQLLESPLSRKFIGFDAFGKFPETGDPGDDSFARKHDLGAGFGIPAAELEKVMAFKGFSSFELIPGNVKATLPAYVEAHPELKIALLNLDFDVYDATMTSLEHLYPRMVRGGIVLLDDYGTVAGATRAVDEYFATRDVAIRKLPFSHIPAYIVVA
jgi:hypothetical protein